MAEPAEKQRVSVAEFLPMIANEEPLELVDGQVVRKAAPMSRHGYVQVTLGALLRPFQRRAGGPSGPGGWWILSEVDTLYGETDEVFRHDLQGYRRDLHPEMPSGFPVPHVPQWSCEILSPSNTRIDWIKKQRTLHAHAVAHYWVIDPAAELVTVLRYQPEAYLVIATAGRGDDRGDEHRLEPFADVSISMDELFGYV
jgi:Uma2 family endonuclease